MIYLMCAYPAQLGSTSQPPHKIIKNISETTEPTCRFTAYWYFGIQ
jgi:hypothetical protein